jgi:tRNA-Thr(GGU) m(6)t(6)A37 methyltransferase TsaA
VKAFELVPIGVVEGGRDENFDDDWGAVESEIVLDAERFGPDALLGLDAFSHAVVVFVFDRIDPQGVALGARRPRGNPDWPEVGVFAQRGSPRPNRLGVTIVEVLAVDGLKVRVRGLDALAGSPVLDLKPVMSGFEPRGAVREPAWAKAVMARYW